MKMLKTGSLLDFKWYQSKIGLEILFSLQHADGSRKVFGLLEQPNLPQTVSVKEVEYKILLVGKTGVGKTATAANLTGHPIPENHYETTGIEVFRNYWPARIRQLNKVVLFNLNFWESGEMAAKKFDHILPACKDGIDCVMFLFSLVDKSSFDDLPQMICRFTELGDDICRIAVGTKFDKFDESEITQRDIENFEQNWEIPVLKIQNLTDTTQGRESVPSMELVLTTICEYLWARDLSLAAKGSKPKVPMESAQEIVF
ncbi:ciliogenesis and planar polarity effector 2 [Octopus sinensis]|uniref:Ciliogenesis and planar polarity effector 2 n=1 Tax=Octopus sinensis TaxID=2607531 RepID=A0A7E6FPC4_9MOLL|nr:ciliogenesis and planar polarity effector 2 [Octopus sinensis]XP_036369547.1 ciliogenesis and planar polarity effector 2 [Octopus sinensis]XP_036369549.1 ciliogenesis and planar polarity effector 2 [Octopus sinensis]